jgi:hypothetical protein
MLRAVLSIAGIVATIAVLIWCFGITVPQITSITPGLNRSVMRTVGLMQGNVTENGREPAGGGGDGGGGSAPAPGGAAPAPQNGANESPGSAPSTTPDTTPGQAPAPSPSRSDQPEIIGPDSTAHLNPAHIHDVQQPGSAWAPPSTDASQAFNPNPPAFAAPNPLPAHPHWTWDVGNREFTNVVVTRVDADLVTIAADSGVAQIDIALLPVEIRRELNYDSALANQAAAARKAASLTKSNP